MRKTDPDPIWLAWSGFGQTHLAWKQAGVQESSGPVSGRTQPARYQFPTFRRSSTDVSDNIVQNQPGSDFSSGRLCRSLARRIRSGSKPMCKNHLDRFWPILPSRSGPDSACLLGGDLQRNKVNSTKRTSSSSSWDDPTRLTGR